LLTETKNKKSKMKIFLAYGDSDRFNDAHHSLAILLNDNNIFIEQGGHSWTTWKKLWKNMLEEKIFDF